MNIDYDVVNIGGASSGAATALMLKRKRPEARVLIIEKGAAFDRKVGESTTEVSSCYMTQDTRHIAAAHLGGRFAHLAIERSPLFDDQDTRFVAFALQHERRCRAGQRAPVD